MWAIIFEMVDALLAGEFRRWWAAHKEVKADEARNKDMAAKSAAAQRELHDDWTE